MVIESFSGVFSIYFFFFLSHIFLKERIDFVDSLIYRQRYNYFISRKRPYCTQYIFIRDEAKRHGLPKSVTSMFKVPYSPHQTLFENLSFYNILYSFHFIFSIAASKSLSGVSSFPYVHFEQALIFFLFIHFLSIIIIIFIPKVKKWLQHYGHFKIFFLYESISLSAIFPYLLYFYTGSTFLNWIDFTNPGIVVGWVLLATLFPVFCISWILGKEWRHFDSSFPFVLTSCAEKIFETIYNDVYISNREQYQEMFDLYRLTFKDFNPIDPTPWTKRIKIK